MAMEAVSLPFVGRPAAGGGACLVFVEGREDVLGRRVALHSEVVMGRDPTCGVCLAAQEVSRRHACIVPQGDGHVVGDLGSLNGTWVNGRTVERARLSPGDRIRVGPYVAAYLPANAAADVPPEPARH